MRNLAYFFVGATGVIAVFILGKSIFIPFVFALLFWLLTREIRLFMDRVHLIKRYFPNWLKNLVVFLLMILTFAGISEILIASFNSLTSSYEEYEPNVQLIINQLNETLNIDITKRVESSIGDFDFGSILSDIINSVSGILGNLFMIIIYALFIFLEEANFKEKLKKIFTNETQYTRINEVTAKIEKSISNYIRLKTLVSLMTGALSYIILLLIGVDFAVFWALLIFLLNFIPSIGSLIATAFPAMFCMVQFGGFTECIIVLLGVGAVQVIIGNVVEPKLMGNNLNLSALVTIIALVFWGKIWGITGMVLSVPITVIMVIVFSQFPKTRSIAILLSEKGNID